MKRSAFFGGVVWITLASYSIWGLHGRVPQLGLIELLFLLGPLVVVPLGLELFATFGSDAEASEFVRAARWVQFPCGGLGDRVILFRTRSARRGPTFTCGRSH